MIRLNEEFPKICRKKGGNKISPSYVVASAAHGLTKGENWKINKDIGPKKDIISIAKREHEVLNSVRGCH